ncbi:MAG: hypothetical protein KGN78_05610 [Actinomycetales bacterium]|nr:hypothetical protein [Actinomycetales bacterium]
MRKGDVARWGRYFEARDGGLGVEAAARRARLSVSSAYRFERGDQGSGGLVAASLLGVSSVGGCVVAAPLGVDAVRALDDFEFFRLRYFGRRSSPWQVRAAYEVLGLLESPDREFVVMNEPPGSGKSTLFTHDIPVWLVVRNRRVRIMVGSRTERQARMYVARMKRSLEREVPLRADADSLARGLSFDAEACLQDDFGAFKPEGRSDLWRGEALVVRQLDGVAVDDKEATVSAYGQDSGFLGGRFDLVVWDDLVDRKNVKTEDARDSIREWWDSEAESRLEPGGLLILQGQRIAVNDLYRYCLDKRTLDESPKYRHVVFKAHDEERCSGEHEVAARPWPEGCLLDPYRIPWKLLETIHHTSPRTYAVMYQQEDGDTVGGLVDPAWIMGGVDADGYPAPGCIDRDRVIGEVPAFLTDGRGWSFVSVDPSPTEFWGIIWWVYDPDSGTRYAIDVVKRRLNPEQFLSLDLTTFDFEGLMVDLTRDAQEQSAPITHVIFEVNAAQRWFLSQRHVQQWMEATGQTFVPHTTHVNKADPKFGLESIGDLFRQGFIRLPWGSPASRLKVNPLIEEATRYPDHDTTDLVMSTWFGKLAVENHYTPRRSGMYQMHRPMWMAGSGRRGIA